jgi:DNA-binding MarR family transcriptional regulator
MQVGVNKERVPRPKSEPDLVEFAARLPRALVETVILQAAQPPKDLPSRRLALAKWIVASRRQRPKAFKKIRLGEPSWDMILDLYVADRENRRIDITGLCLASGVPATTALRYVDLLVEEGLIVKVDDLDDGRRALVNMGAELRAAMDDWLDLAEAGLRVAGWVGRPDPAAPATADVPRTRPR